MRFAETAIEGAFTIDIEPRADARGFFARSFCRREFEAAGLAGAFVQCNISHNAARSTLRGLHYQAEPSPEAKVVRCTRGAVWDVAVDLRPGSGTYLRWTAVELTADNRRSLYVPCGVAHGFQTLTDDAEVFYLMSEFYDPGLARGVRWNDPAFSIRWPCPDPVLSERDASFPDYRPDCRPAGPR